MRRKRSFATVLVIVFMASSLPGCQQKIECTQFTSQDASWAEDHISPDHSHLNASFSDDPFDFSSDVLRELINLNSFPISQGQDEVLFGLRGCQVASSEPNGGFQENVQLQENIPDHSEYRDLIGVWRQSTGEISVYQGSTVPLWWYMCVQVENGGHEANLLPTGRYLYQVRQHRNIEGAFRSEQEVVVLRSNDDLIYEITDDWEMWVPIDNIHPGGCPGKEYSSAGCQTIPGTYGTGCEGVYPEEAEMHLGSWANFRKDAGLDPNNNQDRWEEPYIYILLTCREARLISQGSEPASLTRLRFGSQGDNVLELQEALSGLGYDPGPLDGIMGPRTVMALIEWQKATNNDRADGILTPEIADYLNVELE